MIYPDLIYPDLIYPDRPAPGPTPEHPSHLSTRLALFSAFPDASAVYV
ncbi:MAG TPA: hypothetical protein VGH43_03930 [Jatrophihabitans sp.]